MAKTRWAPVSRRALVARINRRIYDDELVLRATRETSRARLDLGEYFTVNWRINGIAGTNIDLEEYAREVGALRDYEMLKDD